MTKLDYALFGDRLGMADRGVIVMMFLMSVGTDILILSNMGALPEGATEINNHLRAAGVLGGIWMVIPLIADAAADAYQHFDRGATQ